MKASPQTSTILYLLVATGSAFCNWGTFFLLSQNNSISPSESLRASEKHRSSTDYSIDSKKRKAEEKDGLSRYVSLLLAPDLAQVKSGGKPGLGSGEDESQGLSFCPEF